MSQPQPPFEHDPDYWAYNDVQVDQNKVAYVLVNRRAWCAPTVVQEAAYNVALVRAYARAALAKHPDGQWCLRFEPDRSTPTIWPCEKPVNLELPPSNCWCYALEIGASKTASVEVHPHAWRSAASAWALAGTPQDAEFVRRKVVELLAGYGAGHWHVRIDEQGHAEIRSA